MSNRLPVATGFRGAFKRRAEYCCETCRWWVQWTQPRAVPGPDGSQVQLGECRYTAPQLIHVRRDDGVEANHTRWPSTKASDYCRVHPNWLAAEQAHKELLEKLNHL